PERGSPLEPSGLAAPALPGAPQPEGPELESPELESQQLPAREGPPPEDCTVCRAERSAAAEPPPSPDARDAPGEGGPAGTGATDGRAGAAGAQDAVAAGAVRRGEVNMRSAAMDWSPARPELLRVLVAFLLLDFVGGEPLLGLPVGREVADRGRPARRVAPALELRAALQASLCQDLRLLPQRLVEPVEENLIFAHAGAAHAGAGPVGEIAHVSGAISLELLELRLPREHGLLAGGQCFRLASLDVIDDAPHHADPLRLFHCWVSERVSLRAARLVAKSTRSRMSCCRKRCMRGQSASAWSTRGSLPRW